jgi:predicted nucleic acid-binding protein
MIVVDTNLIGYLFLAGERSSQVDRAFLKDPLWVAPLLWRSELRNVLALYLRKQYLNLEETQQIMTEAEQLMREREFAVASHQVLRLVADSTCSAFDCEFVALAKDLNVPLLTVDRKVLEQFPDTAVSLEQFLGV